MSERVNELVGSGRESESGVKPPHPHSKAGGALRAEILHGDVIEQLKMLPDESVHCVVTSPPYWNLRDYKDKDGKSATGQIGLEETVGEYIAKMVTVFEEVRRVLRSDGTLWLNLGDCYAGGGNGGGGTFAKDKVRGTDEVLAGGKNVPGRKGSRGVTVRKKINTESTEDAESAEPNKGKRIIRGSGRWGGGNAASPELKRKDLAGIPWRVALALRAAGWYLRCDIVWNKPNPMPESVSDRPTRSHEYVFLMSKSERYFYDAEAVKEPVSGSSHLRCSQENWDAQAGSKRANGGTNDKPMKASLAGMPRPRGWNYGEGGHDTKEGNYSCGGRPSGWAKSDAKTKTGRYSDGPGPSPFPLPEGEGMAGAKSDKQSQMGRRHAGFNERWKNKQRLATSSPTSHLPGGEILRPLFPDFPELMEVEIDRTGKPIPSPFPLPEGEGMAGAGKSVSKSSRFVTDRIPSKEKRADGGVRANRSFSAAVVGLVLKRSRRSVWTIPTYSYKGEHFATFPPKLVEPCIQAGTSEGGCCAECGRGRARLICGVIQGLMGHEDCVKGGRIVWWWSQKGRRCACCQKKIRISSKKGRTFEVEESPEMAAWKRACGADVNGEYRGEATKDFAGAKAQNASATKARILEGMLEQKTVGWMFDCDCGSGIADCGSKKRKGAKMGGRKEEEGGRRVAPCVVMDPFSGTATVGEVALLSGRRYIGIDISAKYVALANERLGRVQLPLMLV